MSQSGSRFREQFTAVIPDNEEGITAGWATLHPLIVNQTFRKKLGLYSIALLGGQRADGFKYHAMGELRCYVS